MNSPRLCGPLASFIFCIALTISYMPMPATAADSTTFNPLTVSVQAQPISGVPVGTIISWPVNNNPEGWSKGNWLECNGQSLSASAYPELYAAIGGSVPDLRGLFLRGVGGNAAGLGSTQEDAGRNITGTERFGQDADGNAGDLETPGRYVDGAFAMGRRWTDSIYGSTLVSDPTFAVSNWYEHTFDASREWGAAHTADEFRPVNRAVRYLIRARP